MGQSAPIFAEKLAADIEPVREVTLLGSASFDLWKQRLEREELIPIRREGKAQLLMVAAAMKFKGVRFREISFSVLVQNERREAAFLVQAFNTVRFFAFVERNLFSAPYHHGDVQLDVGASPFARVAESNRGRFSMQMATDEARQPAQTGEAGWEGAVLLPRARQKHAGRKYFLARLHGQTRSYPFIPRDRIEIQPSARWPIFHWLIESGFAGFEWSIRESARHSKSKTMSARVPATG
jgi:hypothetical protein